MLDRLIGIATLKPAKYREVADDTTATGQAAMIVIVMAIIAGILGALTIGIANSMLGSSTPGTGVPAVPVGSPLGAFVSGVIRALIGWLVGGWVFAFVATTFFGGKTNTGEMLRVFGFAQIFQLLNIIPCIGWLAALVLSVIGGIIGIREAAEFDNTKAILTGVIGFIVMVVISIILSVVLGAVGLA